MTSEDSKKLRRLIQSLERFSQFDTKMQISTVLALLQIARANEEDVEITPGKVEKLVGLKTGTASRNILYWEKGHKEMRGGHQMITVSMAPDDRRKHLLKLNSKGKAFIKQVVEAIGDG